MIIMSIVIHKGKLFNWLHRHTSDLTSEILIELSSHLTL